jgi:hypothetical protein
MLTCLRMGSNEPASERCQYVLDLIPQTGEWLPQQLHPILPPPRTGHPLKINLTEGSTEKDN